MNIWQWILSLLGLYKPSTTTTTTKPPSVTTTTTTKPSGDTCNLSLPLSDPNPSKYTESFMHDNSNFEECGIEAQLKIIARFCVYRPSVNGWWFISSLVMDKITRNPDGTPNIKCFVQDGYQYHIRGYRSTEPGPNETNPIVSSNPAKYIISECRCLTGNTTTTTTRPGPIITTTTTTVLPSSGNVPNWRTIADVPTYSDTSSPSSPRRASQGEFYGSIPVANADEATNARYIITNWFWRQGQGICTGYPTPDNPKSGCVDVSWDTSLPSTQARRVSWAVNP